MKIGLYLLGILTGVALSYIVRVDVELHEDDSDDEAVDAVYEKVSDTEELGELKELKDKVGDINAKCSLIISALNKIQTGDYSKRSENEAMSYTE